MAADPWSAPLTPEDARAAVGAAIRAAGPKHQILVADLGLRLARLGYLKDLHVVVADSEAAMARGLGGSRRSALVELAGSAEEADPRQKAHEAAGDAQPDLGSATRPVDAHALVSVREACSKRARACLVCGAEFGVNFRHAATHVCCSPACRAKKRRALMGRAPARASGGGERSAYP